MRVETPQWAKEITTRVVNEVVPTWPIKLRPKEGPVVLWYREPDRFGSYGRCWAVAGLIQVVEGAIFEETRLALLHELAHWLTPGRNHSRFFYETAWKLYRMFDLDLDLALKLESRYRKREAPAAFYTSQKDEWLVALQRAIAEGSCRNTQKAKILWLAQHGLTVQVIARILSIRYQVVYNIVKQQTDET